MDGEEDTVGVLWVTVRVQFGNFHGDGRRGMEGEEEKEQDVVAVVSGWKV